MQTAIKLESSWTEIFGSNNTQLTSQEREANWNAWKNATRSAGDNMAAEWWEDLEACEGCKHLDAQRFWCNLQGLPNAFNPVLKMLGMACMGAGKELINDHQPNQYNMNFFQELAAMAPGQKMNLLIAPEGDRLSVSILPISSGNIIPLNVKGTAAELDEGFLDEIRKPMSALTGLQSNADLFESAVIKAANKRTDAGAKATTAASTRPAKIEPIKANEPEKTEPEATATDAAPTDSAAADDEQVKSDADEIKTSILEKIDACTTDAELTKLTREYQERFDKDQDLQGAYGDKRTKLSQAKSAAPAPPKPIPPPRPVPAASDSGLLTPGDQQ